MPSLHRAMTMEEVRKLVESWWSTAMSNAIVEVVASDVYLSFPPESIAVFRTRDGRYHYIEQFGDYTQEIDGEATLTMETRDTLAEVVRELCSEDDRKRLGLT